MAAADEGLRAVPGDPALVAVTAAAFRQFSAMLREQITKPSKRSKLSRFAQATLDFGLPVEFVRERLFKPFETTKNAGMGIGVYESAQYIRSVGGDIRVDSTLGAGTNVSVLLPRPDGVSTASDAGVAPALQSP